MSDFCRDCGVCVNTQAERCPRCIRARNLKLARDWGRRNVKKKRAITGAWIKRNKERFKVLLHRGEKKRRECSLSMDTLVMVLRENGGNMLKSDLRDMVADAGLVLGRAIPYAQKAKIVSETDDGILHLIDTPMLYALDGFYEEKQGAKT